MLKKEKEKGREGGRKEARKKETLVLNKFIFMESTG